MPPLPRILFCQCRFAEVLPPVVKTGVWQGLSAGGQAVTMVDDLCELAARQDPRLKELAGSGPLKIAACHPRAVKWLFAAARAPLPPTGVEILNLRTLSAQEALAALLNSPALHHPSSIIHHPSCGHWHPWFPIIDFDRCTQCRQCLNFCLFGVFGMDAEQHITVQAPESCKTNCPACARVCPEAAIIFPKHNSGPINGEAVSESDWSREKIKVDVSALLGGDVYSALRQRSGPPRPRFSSKRSPEQALRERRRCLARLVQLGDLPPEVLEGLPSLEEGRQRIEDQNMGTTQRGEGAD